MLNEKYISLPTYHMTQFEPMRCVDFQESSLKVMETQPVL